MPVELKTHLGDSKSGLITAKLVHIAESVLSEYSKSAYNLTIVLTGDAEIQELNSRYRYKDKPTNVLSFPFGDGADESLSQIPVKELGDVIISTETALREAIEYGQTFQYRMSWLVVHGILHLLGFDHERSEDDAAVMLETEKSFLDRFYTKRRNNMARLAINVDHVATIREARGIMEPDPVTAAAICELAGAAGIVIHLREDRRHIQDRDVYLLRETIKTRMNLEMGANKEIIKIALDVGPDLVTLVPEKREELTTEGGLDVISQMKKLGKVIEKMEKENIPVSLFVDPELKQLKAAKKVGAEFVELHTGRYCDALSEDEQRREFDLIAEAAEEAISLGLRVNAGHGLNYQNTAPIAALDTIEELSIGHAIIAQSVFTGLDQAVKDMLAIVRQAEFGI